MSRISKAFEGKKALIAFITGGDPDIETTEKLIIAMANSGVDIIEIGIPFSDPAAEGIVIQKASERALRGGCTVDKLFDALKRVREKTDIPLLFMSYINPIFVYGKERFMKNCKECGIDGIIVPDLPFEERDELLAECQQHSIEQIAMVAPTSLERVEMLVKDAKGFIYCVSSLGVTGVRSEIKTDIAEIIDRVKAVTDTPTAIGFGISTPQQAKEMANFAQGVIVGSAIVKIIEKHGRDCIEPVSRFIKEFSL
ncbi:MAG: tryptophan synthase subunit alpha [Oscillospiraceae bacterium]|nr:tryptophan synthase subunit alpha [Oscillospiraceae bacterium]